MFSFFKKKNKGEQTTSAIAPVSGDIYPLTQLGDGVFSENMMGEGIFIEPSDNKFLAPISGTLETVFPTGHAFGIKSDDGVAILIHIGLDTVNLGGKGFSTKVKQGERVEKGDLLTEVDFSVLEENNLKKSAIVVVTTESAKKPTFTLSEGEVMNSTEIFKF